jgi:hypothetical protein
VLKNKQRAARVGVRRFGKRRLCGLCEHIQKPHNAGSRREAPFFDGPLKMKGGEPLENPLQTEQALIMGLQVSVKFFNSNP